MKTLLAIAILVLIGTNPAFAGKKKTPVPVYDQTGTVFSETFHYGSSAEIAVGGDTYFAGCDIVGSHASCSDSRGVYKVRFADGSTMVVGSALAFDGYLGIWEPVGYVLPFPKHEESIPFQFRFVTFTPDMDPISKKPGTRVKGFCIPVVNVEYVGTWNSRPKPVTGEACYEMRYVFSKEESINPAVPLPPPSR